MRESRWLIFGVIFFGLSLFGAWAGEEEKGEAPAHLVIIDDDLGMLKEEVKKAGNYAGPWLKITDPDGGLELIYALREPRIKVLGVTCTMGCSTTEVCMKSAKKILELTGNQNIPVLRGADHPHQLGQRTEAVDFIINTVMKNPGQVEIIATAPLTNIATALMLEPSLPQYWKALHFATGEFLGALGELSDGAQFMAWSGYQDLNINVDPVACRWVLVAGGDFIIYPNEVMDEAWFRSEHRQLLQTAGTPLAKWVLSQTQAYYLVTRLGRLPGIAHHGVIPVAIVADPEVAEPPQKLRVTMAYKEGPGYYFATTDDPSVPTRAVYLKLRHPQTVERRLVERCK